ncbi:thaumatin-like protein 1b [Aegilops tauschii subsp. strangulata]|nr:thaumatin-like protein 1b [Aegilops tauschii subsp. strangulata]
MGRSLLLPLLSLLCLSFLKGARPATFMVTNSCGYTVWPGILSNAGVAPPSTTGFMLSPGESRAVAVADGWSGRMWGRTLCEQGSSGAGFACTTGDCGTGTVECSGRGAAPPATLAEFTLASVGGDDFYDVSLVDGFNVPVLVAPANGSCPTTDCPADMNAQCPPELRVVVAGAAVACRSACEAFGTEAYCCSGAHGTPATCAPTAYSRLFKAACPRAYSYAYDDATSTFTCAGGSAGYGVVFCPAGGSRYARWIIVVGRARHVVAIWHFDRFFLWTCACGQRRMHHAQLDTNYITVKLTSTLYYVYTNYIWMYFNKIVLYYVINLFFKLLCDCLNLRAPTLHGKHLYT